MKSKSRIGEFALCVVQQDRDFRRQNSNNTLNLETPNLNQKIEKKLLISKAPFVLLVFLPFSISHTFDFPYSFFFIFSLLSPQSLTFFSFRFQSFSPILNLVPYGNESLPFYRCKSELQSPDLKLENKKRKEMIEKFKIVRRIPSNLSFSRPLIVDLKLRIGCYTDLGTALSVLGGGVMGLE